MFCLSPTFGADNLPPDLRSIPLEYFSKASHWLSSQDKQVIPNYYGLIGLSRGAELALLLGSRYSEVKGIVAIAPSSVVFPGPPTGFLDLLGDNILPGVKMGKNYHLSQYHFLGPHSEG